MSAVLLGAVLVAYNNLINRWSAFHGPAYVPVNLAVAAALVAFALGPLGLDADALGLGADGVALGAAIGVAATLPLFLALLRPRVARLLADRRVEGLSARAALFTVLVRIPFGTAVLEEVAFRGVLYAEAGGGVRGAVVSSVAFGLWHVVPTIDLIRANRMAATPRAIAVGVAGGVVFTAAGGLFLAWLRARTGAIAAPLALHASINSLAALAALLAHRISSARDRAAGQSLG